MLSMKWQPFCQGGDELTHWGRVTHICVNKLTITGSGNGLSPGRGQAIIWTNAGILLIGPLETNFSELFIEKLNIFIQENSFENVVWKMAAILCRPQCVKVSWTDMMMSWHWNDFALPAICEGKPPATSGLPHTRQYWGALNFHLNKCLNKLSGFDSD